MLKMSAIGVQVRSIAMVGTAVSRKEFTLILVQVEGEMSTSKGTSFASSFFVPSALLFVPSTPPGSSVEADATLSGYCQLDGGPALRVRV
ncbi:hypothetical protein NMY22_g19600 [Coprinellus aureogranulatus]|nr:hypothetical protein NMY22_g19600 [Coprinellus aureogranulatus]